MKKLVCLVLAIVMLVAVAACASAEFKFERKIDLVCPWGRPRLPVGRRRRR